MSIFSNMMGFGGMMADSFGGGIETPESLTEVESALIEQDVPLQSPAMPNELQMALGGGGPGAAPPQQSQVDETQMVGSAADGNIQPSGGGGGLIGNTLSGDSIAGGIAGLVGDSMTGGMVSQAQDAFGAIQDMKNGEQDPMQMLMGLFG